MISRVILKFSKFRYRFWSIISGADIHRDAKICADLLLPHPSGVVIHRDAVIKPGCMIMQQVTIGQLSEPSAPKIGRGVYIGAGAKILGDISIGDSSKIGANAVVLIDVPENATAVGVPAMVIGK